jgi:hypothetical protein
MQHQPQPGVHAVHAPVHEMGLELARQGQVDTSEHELAMAWPFGVMTP